MFEPLSTFPMQTCPPSPGGARPRIPSESMQVEIIPLTGTAAARLVTRHPLLVWAPDGNVVADRHVGGQAWQPTVLQPGDFCLVSGSVQTRFRPRDASVEPPAILRAQPALPLLARAVRDVVDKPLAAFAFRDAAGQPDGNLAALLRLLHGVARQDERPCRYFMHGIAQAFAAHLVRHFCRKGPVPTAIHQGLPPFKLQRAVREMAGALSEPFDLDRVAARVGLSTFHFSRSFKRATGLSPSRYFAHLRIEEAKRLLREERYSVIQVGMAVGYRSPSHFAQVFRTWTGVSPTRFRAGFVPPGVALVRPGLALVSADVDEAR